MSPENYNPNKKAASEDEIDISKVFNALYKGLKTLVKNGLRLIFLFIDTVAGNLKLIAILALVGGLLGLGNYFYTRPFYESNMTLGSTYYRGQLIKNSIENLNSLSAEGNYKTLARALHIPAQQAKHLRSIQIQPIIPPNVQMVIDLYKEDEVSSRHLDSLLLRNQDTTFQVMVQVYDTTAINNLDSALVNYLKENKYVKKRIEIERTNLISRRAKLLKESGNLDTLKHNIALSYKNQAGGRSGTNNVILDDKGTNPIEIYREDMRLYDQLLKIERLLYINSEIEIINPFIAFTKPQSGTLESNVIKGILAGLALALLLILFKITKIGLGKLRRHLNKPDSDTSLGL